MGGLTPYKPEYALILAPKFQNEKGFPGGGWDRPCCCVCSLLSPGTTIYKPGFLSSHTDVLLQNFGLSLASLGMTLPPVCVGEPFKYPIRKKRFQPQQSDKKKK